MIQVAYSPNTGRLRGATGWTDQEWAAGLRRVPALGEAMLTIASVPTNDLQAFVTQQTGLVPAADRYIAINKSQIQWVGTADPLIDSPIPGCVMYAHASALQNWIVDPVLLTVTEPALTSQEISVLTAAKLAMGIVNWMPPASVVSSLVVTVFKTQNQAVVA